MAANVTACQETSETQVQVSAQGDTAQIEVTPANEDEVEVKVTGTVQFDGTGSAVVSDTGGLSISGNGSMAGSGSTAEDFTLTGQLNAC